MKLQFKKPCYIYILFTFLLWCQNALTQDGATLYKSCAACHSIGGGRMVGPDLKGVTQRRTNEWLIKFIQSPAELTKSGDAQAKALFQEYNNMPMPNNAFSVDEVNKILQYIDGETPAGNSAADPEKAALQNKIDAMLKANSATDINKGRALFYGIRRFENSGASCASCHNATYNNIAKGGILAKDLTKAYSRLGGFAGIKGIVASPPFPSMAATYKNNAVTDEENAYLQLFLKSTDAQNLTEPLMHKTWFLHTALTLGFLIALSIALIWIRRKRKSVNHAIMKRQERHSM